MKHQKKLAFYHIFSEKSAWLAGHPLAFILAVLFIIIWLFLGIVYHFSDTWQLIINTVTNIAEFLILFLIQNTQNRESKNLNIKLDELLISNKHAKNSVINLDDLSDNELKELEEEYKRISNH